MRPRPTSGLRRWLTIAMVAWLGLVLVGREHVLQAFGIHLACVHPGGTGERSEPAVRTHDGHAQHGDGDHAATSAAHDDASDQVGDDASHDRRDVATSDHDGGGADDCPPGCTECACGAAPCAPTMPHVIADRLWTFRDFDARPHLAGPTRDATTLERPPRQG
jgi:hypothetical protein